MKAIISNSLLSNIQPKDKAYDIWDTKLTGFILRVNPTGTIVYRCEYARGKRVTIGKTTVLTPAQARDYAKEILADAVKGNLPVTKKSKKALPTLKQFIENDYATWRCANRKSAIKDINRLKSKFLDEFGDYLLIDISPLEIDKWRSRRIKDGTKPITVNRDISVLKAMLAKAHEWKIIDEHPLQSFKLSSVDVITKVRYLTKDEESRLKKTLVSRDQKLKIARSQANAWRKERNYPLLSDLHHYAFADHMTPMILLSLNTGLRKGELFNLLWTNINFERSLLTVTGDIAKSGKTRHIPLNKIALEVLKNWRIQTKESNFVFANTKTNAPFDNVKKAWINILQSVEIENFRWHDMRHHFASKLVMAGIDLNTVRELLGHADIKMTLRYAHLAPEHKADAVARLVE